MHVIPSSAQADYNQASSSCKLTAPRIAASLDETPLNILCDSDRGTLEDVEFCGLYAAETSFAELEVSSGRFSNCQFLSCDFTGALLVDIAFEGCDFSSADMTEMELHGISLADDRFVGTSFFRTKLVGLDFTSCQLEGIAISDAMTEVYGAKLGLYQAAALARRLGAIIEE